MSHSCSIQLRRREIRVNVLSFQSINGFIGFTHHKGWAWTMTANNEQEGAEGRIHSAQLWGQLYSFYIPLLQL